GERRSERKAKEAAKTSASSKKLEGSKDHYVPINDSVGYVVLNFLTVFSALSACVKCKQCGNDVTRASERCLDFNELQFMPAGYHLLLSIRREHL
ncbi:hypothetical protein J437_LFUL014368, partial [Ladona fulva]